MKELRRSEIGAYVSHRAFDGSGHDRTDTLLLLDLMDELPPELREMEIGYLEHLHIRFMRRHP